MTRPGIEPRSPGPLANTLTLAYNDLLGLSEQETFKLDKLRSYKHKLYIYIYIYIYSLCLYLQTAIYVNVV